MIFLGGLGSNKTVYQVVREAMDKTVNPWHPGMTVTPVHPGMTVTPIAGVHLGHGGGGHGGGGHHHGGGRGYFPGYSYDGGYGPDVVVVESTPTCPMNYEPVLASDGQIYGNACLATAAGHTVVRKVNPKTLSGIDLSSIGTPMALGAIALAGVVVFAATRRRKRRR